MDEKVKIGLMNQVAYIIGMLNGVHYMCDQEKDTRMVGYLDELMSSMYVIKETLERDYAPEEEEE